MLFRVASIKRNGLQVVGNDDVACERFVRFARIPLGACFQRAVFGVVQNEVSCPKLLRVPPRIERGAVAFLVWSEPLAVGVGAERLVHQPVGVLRVFSAKRIERLVAEAAKTQSVCEGCREAELRLLRRMDVEALETHVADAECPAVFQSAKRDEVAKARNFLLRKDLPTNTVEKRQHFCMAPDIQAVSELERHADKPYHAEQMVGMRVRDKEVVYLLFPQPGAFQLRQDSISASGIDEKNASCGAVQWIRNTASAQMFLKPSLFLSATV